MKYSADVLLIGGGPAAAACAVTAKRYYPDKRVTILKDKEPGIIPCGIPYMINSLEKPDQNVLPFDPIEEKGVNVVIDRANKIRRAEKQVATENGDAYKYEKLILATGSKPIKPPIKGIDLENVYTVEKDYGQLKGLIDSVKGSRNIALIGGGFIGVEFADEISHLEGKNIYLIEMLPGILNNSFDTRFSELAEDRLKERGVNIITDTKVEEILGDGKVEKVSLSGGTTVDADMVILCIGAGPNTELAQTADLPLGSENGIWVDEYLRTADIDIFAIGDCSSKRDFFTRRNTVVMLASTATAEARVAGANLYRLQVIRENKGTIAIYSTYISGLVLGSAGLIEKTAREEGFDVVIGESEAMDKHPGTLPGSSNLVVRLLFSRQAGILMGGQVAGGETAGEIINTIGVCIQKNVSINEVESFQIATHPYLTPSPTKYSMTLAAMQAG